MKFRRYIDFVILACCLVIAFNIHPSKIVDSNVKTEKHSMIYIFHDYEWNEYIMNDKIHWAPDSRDYLFDDEVPNGLKWENEKITWSVSLWDLTNDESSNSNTEDNSIKDNQISLDDIVSELWLNSEDVNTSQKGSESTSSSDILVISIWDPEESSDEKTNYIVKEVEVSDDTSSLIIEKAEDSTGELNYQPSNNDMAENSGSKTIENDNLFVAKAFTFVEEWRVLPTLVSRDDLFFDDSNQPIAYNNSELNWNFNNQTKKSGITIIDDYEDCMTPWWYKIHHWESVLAYKQMEDALDICNIERRFCWKWKLSGTYTQQWCSVNKNYTYEQWWEVKVVAKTDWKDNFKWNTRQNPDWSVTVKSSEIWWSFVFDKPNNTYTSFRDSGNNIRFEYSWTEQTSRTYEDCTAPRGEKVKHWQFIQAFKHENWFSDAPCEAQIRLCTMWELMGTFTESTCRTRDTSFIDWINGSPSRITYSEEKLDLVRKQIKDKKIYYKNIRENAEKSTDSDVLDRILYILDQD